MIVCLIGESVDGNGMKRDARFISATSHSHLNKILAYGIVLSIVSSRPIESNMPMVWSNMLNRFCHIRQHVCCDVTNLPNFDRIESLTIRAIFGNLYLYTGYRTIAFCALFSLPGVRFESLELVHRYN